MPVHNKSRNSSSRLQHHHRTNSGGSSKVGLNNLQLSQKDPVQPKQHRHSAVEVHPGRTTAACPRPAHLTSNHRVPSKERITTAQQKRTHAPLSNLGKQQQQLQRAAFSLAHSDETDDDDEWVSSESGAATPQKIVEFDDDDDDDDASRGATTPVERQRAIAPLTGTTNGTNIYGMADRAANGVNDVTTPRAEEEVGLTRVETIRPETATSRTRPPDQILPPVVRVQPQSTPATPVVTPPPAAKQNTNESFSRQIRSEAPSPSQVRQRGAATRQPLTRHSTTHGETKSSMPPHPLIRGQSFHGPASRPARLAPLTVNSEAAHAQLTASPSSAKSPSRAGSPLSMTHSINRSPSETSTVSQDARTRRGSISSLHSIATLPAPMSRRYDGARSSKDRTRTLSTISTSSSSAALSALNMLPNMSRPGTPPTVVRFPIKNQRDIHDGIHPLLPPVYLASHMTCTAKYNPLYDSYERVMRAKHGRQ